LKREKRKEKREKRKENGRFFRFLPLGKTEDGIEEKKNPI